MTEQIDLRQQHVIGQHLGFGLIVSRRRFRLTLRRFRLELRRFRLRLQSQLVHGDAFRRRLAVTLYSVKNTTKRL